MSVICHTPQRQEIINYATFSGPQIPIVSTVLLMKNNIDCQLAVSLLFVGTFTNVVAV